jgi:hypothetical protein
MAGPHDISMGWITQKTYPLLLSAVVEFGFVGVSLISWSLPRNCILLKDMCLPVVGYQRLRISFVVLTEYVMM